MTENLFTDTLWKGLAPVYHRGFILFNIHEDRQGTTFSYSHLKSLVLNMYIRHPHAQRRGTTATIFYTYNIPLRS